MIEAEGFQGVQQDDIQIADQAAMLETIVEDDQLRFQFLDGDSSGGHAIGVLHVRHVGEFLLQLPGLVVAAAFLGSVTAAYDRHANLMPPKPSGDPFDQRRFTRSAERYITHAYNRHASMVDRRLAAVVALLRKVMASA